MNRSNRRGKKESTSHDDDMDSYTVPLSSSRRSSRQSSVDRIPPNRPQKNTHNIPAIQEEEPDSSMPSLSMAASQMEVEQNDEHENDNNDEHHQDNEEEEEGGEEEAEAGEGEGEGDGEGEGEEGDDQVGDEAKDDTISQNGSHDGKLRTKSEHDTFYDQFPDSELVKLLTIGFNGDYSFKDVMGTPETGTRICRFNRDTLTEARLGVVDYAWNIVKMMYETDVKSLILARDENKHKIEITSKMVTDAKKVLEKRANQSSMTEHINPTKEYKKLIKETKDQKTHHLSTRRPIDISHIQAQKEKKKRYHEYMARMQKKSQNTEHKEDGSDEVLDVVDL